MTIYIITNVIHYITITRVYIYIYTCVYIVVVDSGILEDTLPVYSPFYRSLTDLYMYNQELYTHSGVVVSAAFVSGSGNDDIDNDIDIMEAVRDVYEMKNGEKNPVRSNYIQI